MLRRLLVVLLPLLAWPGLASARGHPTVTSSAPQAVAVTLYRDPNRVPTGEIDRNRPQGFALVRETRRVTLPPGAVTIRFEGVASGLQPESAIVSAVSVGEKNQDRRLLSERGLLEAWQGRAVALRRFNPATGQYSEQSATILSRPDGLVLRTPDGVEVLHCSGLDETLLFPSVPSTLTAKPTLSVETGDQPGGDTEIELVYLAQNFDWQANYVAQLSDNGDAVDLTGWMTMVSGDATNFADAQLLAVAGKVNREPASDRNDDIEPVRSSCWPSGTTGNIAPIRMMTRTLQPQALVLPAPPPMAMARFSESDSIVVTATRRAELEQLGDLKLYRVPFAVTVAAQSQKQVAFLAKQGTRGTIIYRLSDAHDENDVVEMVWRTKNTVGEGLGEPLPSGNYAFFQGAGDERQLIGEVGSADKAVDEKVELAFARASNVTVATDDTERYGDKWDERRLVVRNANGFAIQFEAEFPASPSDFDSRSYERFSMKMLRRDGKLVWAVTIPPNSERSLRYRRVDVD